MYYLVSSFFSSLYCPPQKDALHQSPMQKKYLKFNLCYVCMLSTGCLELG